LRPFADKKFPLGTLEMTVIEIKQGSPKNEKPPAIKLACMVDGKKVAEGTDGRAHRFEYWSYTGKTSKDTVGWQQHRFALKNISAYRDKNEPKDSWVWAEHPGDYRCVALAGGETVKEVFFSIAADGLVGRLLGREVAPSRTSRCDRGTVSAGARTARPESVDRAAARRTTDNQSPPPARSAPDRARCE